MPTPAESLTKELEAMQELRALLQLEQTALTENAVETLPDLISTKGHLVSKITILADARQGRLSDIGIEASENGMQQWIDTSAAASEKTVWDTLLEVAKVVKEHNRLNGLVISKLLVTNQEALNIFQGKVGGTAFYGPDGQSSVKINNRKFGSV